MSVKMCELWVFIVFIVMKTGSVDLGKYQNFSSQLSTGLGDDSVQELILGLMASSEQSSCKQVRPFNHFPATDSPISRGHVCIDSAQSLSLSIL